YVSDNSFYIPSEGIDHRYFVVTGSVFILFSFFGFRLLPRMFFGPGGTPLPGVNTPLPHSAPNAATSPFYKNVLVVNPNAYPGAPGIHNPRVQFDQTGTKYRGVGNYFFYNFAART